MMLNATHRDILLKNSRRVYENFLRYLSMQQIFTS